VTIADFRSSLAGAGGVSGIAAPFHTITGTSNGTAFRFPPVSDKLPVK
jgi:hypothetical protein